MPQTTLKSDGTMALKSLQDVVQNKEVIHGRLLNIGTSSQALTIAPADGQENLLLFKVAEQAGDIPEAGQGTVLELVAGHPPEKDGFTLVCFGPIFVAGDLKLVAAYRPS